MLTPYQRFTVNLGPFQKPLLPAERRDASASNRKFGKFCTIDLQQVSEIASNPAQPIITEWDCTARDIVCVTLVHYNGRELQHPRLVA